MIASVHVAVRYPEDLRSVGRDNRGACIAAFFFFSTPLHELFSVVLKHLKNTFMKVICY